MDFPNGGSISSSNGATITFGSGGSLALGSGGSITLGNGGSITPDPAGGAPDMSNGGTIVLGPNGAIQFGSGGSLVTGNGGAISTPADSAFDVQSARSVTIHADGSVHLGTLDTHGTIEMNAAGNMSDGDTGTPVNLAMIAADTGTDINVNSGGDLTWKEIDGDPQSITLNAGGAITMGGPYSPGGPNNPAGASYGCGSPGSTSTAVVYTKDSDGGYSGSYDCTTSTGTESGSYGGVLVVEPIRVESAGSSGGPMDLAGMLLLVGARLRRQLGKSQVR